MFLIVQVEIDETLKRIESTHKSVIGVLVCNKDGVIIRSTFSNASANTAGTASNTGNTATGGTGPQGEYSNAILQIVDKAKEALKDNDELTFVKVKTKKNEFIVVPGAYALEKGHLFHETVFFCDFNSLQYFLR